MGVPELLDELLVGGSLLEDVEILTMQVLDQRLLETSRFIGRLNQHRDGLEARPPGCPPPSFAGDQLEFVGGVTADLPHQHGLEDAQLLDGSSQRGHGVLVEGDPRLSGVGLDAPDRYVTKGRRPITGHLGGDQGAEPLAESATSCHR